MTKHARPYYNCNMLTVEWSEDRRLLDGLSRAIFDCSARDLCGAVLSCDGVYCGVAFYGVGECIHIKSVGILPEYRGNGYGDFFTRTLIYKFMFYNKDIVVDYHDDYYINLGFVSDGDGSMRASCDDVVFPSGCEHTGGSR